MFSAIFKKKILLFFCTNVCIHLCISVFVYLCSNIHWCYTICSEANCTVIQSRAAPSCTLNCNAAKHWSALYHRVRHLDTSCSKWLEPPGFLISWIFRTILPFELCLIWAYLAMGIWAYVKKIWSSGVSHKKASKMQLRNVDLRSVGPSVQKLWPTTFFARKIPCILHCNEKKLGYLFLD